jgi:hypothetical protein
MTAVDLTNMPTGHLIESINEMSEGMRTDIRHMLFLEDSLEEYYKELLKRV